MTTKGFFRLTHGAGHVGLYVGPLYIGVCRSLFLSIHLWPCFVWRGSPENCPIFRLGPITLTWWKGNYANSRKHQGSRTRLQA